MTSSHADPQRSMLTVLALALITLVFFFEVPLNDFVLYDDPRYVTNNPVVLGAFTREGLRWAFTSLDAGFWHPLTWLSLMVDGWTFGLNPQGYHLHNLLLHVANVMILFCLFRAMSGSLWKSFAVAVLFALHPLHVESVAWVSQRKDLLSTLFGFLTLWAYVRYSETLSRRWYAAAFLLFLLGIMAKPMLIPFPFVMLLLDYWPLGRAPLKPFRTELSPVCPPRSWLALVAEKVPFLAAALVAAGLTFLAEAHIGALPSLAEVPIETRLSNAVISYGRYILKTFWPFDLAVVYPRTLTISVSMLTLSASLLTAISVWAVLSARRLPYLLVGWLWYMGILIPVIGLVQIGSHTMADRYTYVPLIGLFVMIVWGVEEIASRFTHWREPLWIGTAILAACLGLVTREQVRVWQDSESLFRWAVEATENNYLARNYLGLVLASEHRYEEAAEQYRRALSIQPGFLEARYNLGVALQMQGKPEEAARHFTAVIEAKPLLEMPHFQLGNLSLSKGDFAEAASHYRKAVAINPRNHQTYNNLGIALLRAGKKEEAIHQFREALRLDPNDKKAKANLKEALRVPSAETCW